MAREKKNIFFLMVDLTGIQAIQQYRYSHFSYIPSKLIFYFNYSPPKLTRKEGFSICEVLWMWSGKKKEIV